MGVDVCVRVCVPFTHGGVMSAQKRPEECEPQMS